jgi:hypothetical protein
VTTVSMHGGGQMLEVKDALKHHVSITIPNGGSVSQLDMWKLMINKVCTASARRACFLASVPARASCPPNATLLSSPCTSRHSVTPDLQFILAYTLAMRVALRAAHHDDARALVIQEHAGKHANAAQHI